MKFSSRMLPIVFCLGLSYAHAASFDCAKELTQVEKAICASTKLSHLDDELATAYNAKLLNHSDPTFFKSEQLSWLRDVRNKCQDEHCIVDAYETKLSTLNDAPSKPNISTDPRAFSQSYLEDQTGSLTMKEKEEIVKRLAALRQAGPTIAFFITQSTNGQRIQDLVAQVRGVWTAVLEIPSIVIVFAKEDQQFRMLMDETLRSVITDEESKKLITQVMIPELQRGAIGVGILNALDRIDALFAQSRLAAAAQKQATALTKQKEEEVAIAKKKADDEAAAIEKKNGERNELIKAIAMFGTIFTVIGLLIYAIFVIKIKNAKKLNTGSGANKSQLRARVEKTISFVGIFVLMGVGYNVYRSQTAVTSDINKSKAEELKSEIVLLECKPPKLTIKDQRPQGCYEINPSHPEKFIISATEEYDSNSKRVRVKLLDMQNESGSAIRGVHAQCVGLTEPLTPREYDIEFGGGDLPFIGYYALPNFRNHPKFKRAEDEWYVAAQSLEFKSSYLNCRVISVIIPSLIEIQRINSDLHNLSNANILADDPLLKLKQAYARFDSRCRQAAGEATASMINSVEQTRRNGGSLAAGLGSVDGQLMMLKSIGCIQ